MACWAALSYIHFTLSKVDGGRPGTRGHEFWGAPHLTQKEDGPGYPNHARLVPQISTDRFKSDLRPEPASSSEVWEALGKTTVLEVRRNLWVQFCGSKLVS